MQTNTTPCPEPTENTEATSPARDPRARYSDDVLVFVDDPEFVLHRKRRLADLVATVGKRLIIVPMRRPRGDVPIESTLVAWLLRNLGLDVELSFLPVDGVARTRAMTAMVDSWRPRLVVIPDETRGRRAARIAGALHRRTGVPVIRFAAEADEEHTENACFDHVIAACRRELGDSVTRVSADLAEAIGCEMTLVDVIDSARAAGEVHEKRRGGARVESAVARARAGLERRIHHLVARRTVRRSGRVVRVGDTARELDAVARDFDNPLVVTAYPPEAPPVDAPAPVAHRIKEASVLAVAAPPLGVAS